MIIRTVQGPGVHVDASAEGKLVGGAVLFLDRDGVINVDRGYVCSIEATVWVTGIFELCRAAQRLGFGLIVVTNQAGIARGYYSESQFLDYTRWMHEAFRQRGIVLSATIYCPHHPTEGIGELRQACSCRKPEPGMLLEAQRRFLLDMQKSAMVGDKKSDMDAGIAAGIGRLFYIGSERSLGPGVARCSSVSDILSYFA